MRSILAGMAVLLLAGCGTAAAQARATVSVSPGQARAQAYVRRAVAGLSLPAGTRSAHSGAATGILQLPAPGPGWAGASRLLIVPGKPQAVVNRISAHAPFSHLGGGTTFPSVASTTLTAPEPGIDAVIIDLGAQAYSRTRTLVSVEVWAAWLPYRTAAEHLNPAAFGSVTVTRNQVSYGKERSESRTFTSTALIARLAAVLNAGVPAPDAATAQILGCMPGTSYTFSFTARARHGPAVTASPSCDAIAISVNGKQQPALWDDGDLETIAGPLFGR